MSRLDDIPVGSDPQEDFPGHCTYCGALCETCAGQADLRDGPRDY